MTSYNRRGGACSSRSKAYVSSLAIRVFYSFVSGRSKPLPYAQSENRRNFIAVNILISGRIFFL
jgi:hypothetical protein